MLPRVCVGTAPSRRCLEFRPESLKEKFWSKLECTSLRGHDGPADLTSDCGAPGVTVPLSQRRAVAAAASRMRSFMGFLSFCRDFDPADALTSTVVSPSVGWMGAVETKGVALDVRPRGKFSGILAIFPRLVGKCVFAAIFRRIERLTGSRFEMNSGDEMLMREHVDRYWRRYGSFSMSVLSPSDSRTT